MPNSHPTVSKLALAAHVKIRGKNALLESLALSVPTTVYLASFRTVTVLTLTLPNTDLKRPYDLKSYIASIVH